MSAKVEDHQLIVVFQSPEVFGDEMLSLGLSLKGERCLDACLGSFCSHRAIEYGTEVLLDGRLAPRPCLWDAQG